MEKLNKYLENNNINIKNDVIDTNKKEKKIIVDNNNIDDIEIEKVNKMLKKDYVYKSTKDDDLCIILDCNNKRSKMVGNIIEYCKNHANEAFSFEFNL
jgi:nanoRNase/pAp phosphatase (c-di-AMP/oligoRNAs hydrolase)